MSDQRLKLLEARVEHLESMFRRTLASAEDMSKLVHEMALHLAEKQRKAAGDSETLQ